MHSERGSGNSRQPRSGHACSLLLSVPLVAVAGVPAARCLPGWDELVTDVGTAGAWFIQTIYQHIDALIIVIATIGGVEALLKAGAFPSVRESALSALDKYSCDQRID